jgi:hypothetical protein
MGVAAIAGAALIAGCGGDSEDTEEPRVPFQPRASLTAVGGTNRTEKPQFVIKVKARAGDANIRSAAVTLPPVVLVDQAAIGNICSRSELQTEDCAGHPRMGVARVVSPVYNGALEGPVYAVSGFGGLPHLAYILRGPAKVVLRGRILTKGARLQAGIEDIPNTPLDTFEFRIDGGKNGYLVLNQDICATDAMADAVFTGQGGERHREQIPLEADCGP